MTKRVPTVSVVVTREGKRVSPPLNKSFDFTDGEIETINRVQPGALRKPVNETAAEGSAEKPDAVPTTGAAKEKMPASKPKADKKPKTEKPADEDEDDGDEDEDADI